jgi:hypothetical protein
MRGGVGRHPMAAEHRPVGDRGGIEPAGERGRTEFGLVIE